MTYELQDGPRVFASLQKNVRYMNERLQIDTSYDLEYRKYHVSKDNVIYAYFVNGLTEDMQMIQLFRQMAQIDSIDQVDIFHQLLNMTLTHSQVECTDNLDEAIDRMLSGLLILFGEGWKKALIVDIRSYPGRNPDEPDTERVVRGARDGFTENIIMNTGLIRRRIRDERLCMEMVQVGERSKTDICISYVRDIANPTLINEIKQVLDSIEIDGIPMAEKVIEEYVINQGYNPFPKVRFTERPDVCATHLFEGHVLVMVDTSPSVIILPTTYFHHLQHAEEFRQSPALGMYVRWIRFFGVLVSIFILPLWLLYALEPDLLPVRLAFIGPNDTDYELSLFWQFLLAEIGVDLIRMAAIHTPSPLATAMGLVAAVLIGEMAIDVGFFISEVILYLAVAIIGMFATPSYEMSLANKHIRLFLLIMVVIAKTAGFVIGVTLVVLFLVGTKSLRTPYMWPFIPFNGKAFLTIVLRLTSTMIEKRPSIAHPQNKHNQPNE